MIVSTQLGNPRLQRFGGNRGIRLLELFSAFHRWFV
jgi:hypothetical protein